MVFTAARVRVDLSGLAGKRMDLRYCRDTGNLVLVDHSRRSYLRLGAGALTGVGDAVQTVRDFIGRKLGEPPRDPGNRDAPLDLRSTAETQTLSGLTCRKHVLQADGAVAQEVWAASWGQAGIAKADLAAVHELVRTMQSVGPVLELGLGVPGGLLRLEGITRIDGYPVLVIQSDGGRPAYAAHLGRPRNTNVEPGDFLVPEGYGIAWMGGEDRSR
jgi:hypothetical protein